jgi:hypothetical protein
MTVNPEVKRRERRGVYDAYAICLAGNEREGRVLVESDSGSYR